MSEPERTGYPRAMLPAALIPPQGRQLLMQAALVDPKGRIAESIDRTRALAAATDRVHQLYPWLFNL